MPVRRSGAASKTLGHEVAVHRAGPVDHLDAELLLAAGEVVVQRAEGGVGVGDDLLEPGARVAVAHEQGGGGVENPLSSSGPDSTGVAIGGLLYR